jgi:hypothetical protein
MINLPARSVRLSLDIVNKVSTQLDLFEGGFCGNGIAL